MQKDKKWDGPGIGVEVAQNKYNMQEQHQMSLQEGAGGQSSTVLCFPKGMHVAPGSGPFHSCLSLGSRLLQNPFGFEGAMYAISKHVPKMILHPATSTFTTKAHLT